MKKNNKGFTLIELLVVVAIIGILAAVGTVAYNGYTAGAKKSAAKSNHASVVKYIAAEDQKCNIGEDTAMSGELTCLNRTGAEVITAALTALEDFKNPYDTNSGSVRKDGAFAAKADMGFVNIKADGDELTITTCFQNDCATPAADEPANTIDNTIQVGE